VTDVITRIKGHQTKWRNYTKWRSKNPQNPAGTRDPGRRQIWEDQII